MKHFRWQFNAICAEPFHEVWTQAGGYKVAGGLAVFINAGHFVVEDILGGDGVTLKVLHLGYVGNFAAAVLYSGLMNNQVDGGGYLLPDGPNRKIEAGH